MSAGIAEKLLQEAKKTLTDQQVRDTVLPNLKSMVREVLNHETKLQANSNARRIVNQYKTSLKSLDRTAQIAVEKELFEAGAKRFGLKSLKWTLYSSLGTFISGFSFVRGAYAGYRGEGTGIAEGLSGPTGAVVEGVNQVAQDVSQKELVEGAVRGTADIAAEVTGVRVESSLQTRERQAQADISGSGAANRLRPETTFAERSEVQRRREKRARERNDWITSGYPAWLFDLLY